MLTWVTYYGARDYLVNEAEVDSRNWSHDDLADALGISPLELYEMGFGTDWHEVASLNLDRSCRWFAQGDPWNALIGVGRESIAVTCLELTTTGLAGPATLIGTRPEFIHTRSQLPETLESLAKIRKAMQRRWRRCPDCQGARLRGECTCNGPLLGIIYD